MKSEFSNKANNRTPVLGRQNLLERYLKSNTHDWGVLRFMMLDHTKNKVSGSVKTMKDIQSNGK